MTTIFNIALIGDSNVGKSTWIKSLTNDQCKIVLSTTNGKFEFIFTEYLLEDFKNTENNYDFVIAMCDITKSETFDHIVKYMKLVSDEYLLIIGNKSDCSNDRKIHVNWCGTCNEFNYTEISCLTGEKIYVPLLNILKDHFKQEVHLLATTDFVQEKINKGMFINYRAEIHRTLMKEITK